MECVLCQKCLTHRGGKKDAAILDEIVHDPNDVTDITINCNLEKNY